MQCHNPYMENLQELLENIFLQVQVWIRQEALPHDTWNEDSVCD